MGLRVLDINIRLERMNAAGNTFLFCDLSQFPIDAKERPFLVKKWCESYQGFQTDGVVFYHLTSSQSLKWDFYNRDGSVAEMCGNAARAMAKLLNGEADQQWTLSTLAGPVILQNIPNQDRALVMWNLKAQMHWENDFDLNGQMIPFDYILAGVPHAVVESDPFPELAKVLRSYKQFHPGGMNVTFVEQTTPGEVTAVTFERGVEDFTLACGTGAIAAAYWSRELNPELNHHWITMPGGVLEVYFDQKGQVTLTGPAIKEFTMEVVL